MQGESKKICIFLKIYEKCSKPFLSLLILGKIRKNFFLCLFLQKSNDPARTRTWNLLIRSQTPYPLGHEAAATGEVNLRVSLQGTETLY